MAPTSMQKHIGNKRPDDGNAYVMQTADFRKANGIGNKSVLIYKCFRLVRIEKKDFEQEYTNIDQNEQPVYNRV